MVRAEGKNAAQSLMSIVKRMQQIGDECYLPDGALLHYEALVLNRLGSFAAMAKETYNEGIKYYKKSHENLQIYRKRS